MRKNKICLVVISFLVFSLGLVILKLSANKELKIFHDEKPNIVEAKSLKYFDTKYTLYDMYSIIASKEIPDDEEFDDILLNWFDYFSENNLFINHFGESYNFSEYQRIKDEYSGETLKTLLINAKKSWFLPILSE